MVDATGAPLGGNPIGGDATRMVGAGAAVLTAGAGGLGLVGVKAAELTVAGLYKTTEHMALRMSQRGISMDVVETTLTKAVPTPYFHEGIWKLGFWNAEAKVFIGTIQGRITTVMQSSERYIQNLFNSGKKGP
jgi:hypothetical protein